MQYCKEVVNPSLSPSRQAAYTFQGTRHMEYGGLKGIRGLAAAGPNGFMIFFHDSIILLDCFHEKLVATQERSG